jgi:MFS family permease
MGRMQILIVVITVTLNMLDGFDVASIALATNGIMTEFGLTDRSQLGIVLAAELVGMAIGSIFLGGVADRFGRRPMMLGCLVVMSLGMVMVTREPGILANGLHNAALSLGLLQDTQTGIIHILVWRVITGLGIGGMLAAINAVVAEYSNKRRKHLNVSIMAMGYPIGVAIGSQISSVLLVNYTWHSVFYLGFFWTLALLPIVYFFVPETVSWVAMKRPPGAVEKISATMLRLGHGPVKELPPLNHAGRPSPAQHKPAASLRRGPCAGFGAAAGHCPGLSARASDWPFERPRRSRDKGLSAAGRAARPFPDRALSSQPESATGSSCRSRTVPPDKRTHRPRR